MRGSSSKESNWRWVDGGLSAGELDYVGMAFVADDGVEHFFDLWERAELLTLGAAGGVADGAAQVAVVADFDQRQARVLLVVGAEAAVVGASPFDGSVVDEGHLGGLDEDFAGAAVVVDVVGDEDFFCAVLGAAFEQVDVAVLENGFGFDFAVAGGADGDGYVVEEVGAGFVGHGVPRGRYAANDGNVISGRGFADGDLWRFAECHRWQIPTSRKDARNGAHGRKINSS
jgi:hypothetical protein